MVYLDLFGGVINTIELIVHESAHLYFFLAESNSKLLEYDNSTLYWSPLRHEKRPLHGIFLGYHALAYICAFYKEIYKAKVVKDMRYIREWEKHSQQMKICEQTLDSAVDSLTTEGISFFKKTKEIAVQSYNNHSYT